MQHNQCRLLRQRWRAGVPQVQTPDADHATPPVPDGVLVPGKHQRLIFCLRRRHSPIPIRAISRHKNSKRATAAPNCKAISMEPARQPSNFAASAACPEPSIGKTSATPSIDHRVDGQIRLFQAPLLRELQIGFFNLFLENHKSALATCFGDTTS